MNVRRRTAPMYVGIMILLAIVFLIATAPTEAAGPKKKFTLVNVDLDGTKIWLPGSITVREGDEVELTLINKLEVPHGFKIDVFGIEAIVAAKSKSTVTFTAKMAGVHEYVCQLHPPHVGGQIQVLTK